MNNRGFTLIELLAIILLLGIVSSIGIYSVSSYIESSRNKSDELLWDNIRIAGKTYIDECTSGASTLSCSLNIDTTDINNNTYSSIVTLNTLASLNFLNVISDKKTNNEGNIEEQLKVVDSKGNDIGDCQITIAKNINKSNYNVSYAISSENNDNRCKNLKNKSGN